MSLRRIRIDNKDIDVIMQNWVDQTQHRDYWRALVHAAFNIRVPKAMELITYKNCMMSFLNNSLIARVDD